MGIEVLDVLYRSRGEAGSSREELGEKPGSNRGPRTVLENNFGIFLQQKQPPSPPPLRDVMSTSCLETEAEAEAEADE